MATDRSKWIELWYCAVTQYEKCQFYVNMRSQHYSHISQKCAYRIFFCIHCHFLHFRFYANMRTWPNSAYFRCIFRLITVRKFLKNCCIKPARLTDRNKVEGKDMATDRKVMYSHNHRLDVQREKLALPPTPPLQPHTLDSRRKWTILISL